MSPTLRHTKHYADVDTTNKQVTITIPGKAFSATSERWIRNSQGDTIIKAKYKVEGTTVAEQPWIRKTILKITG